MANLVFISYAREDQQCAEQLYLDLTNAAVEVWMDSHNLLPGQTWENEVEDAISRSSYFISLQSARSVDKRGHVQKELRLALEVAEKCPEGKMYIIPVRIDECEPSFTALRKIHRLDLFPDYNYSLSILLTLFGYTEESGPRFSYLEKYERQGLIQRTSDSGYGFIYSSDFKGDLFFHRLWVGNVAFDKLNAGDEITFLLAKTETDKWVATQINLA